MKKCHFCGYEAVECLHRNENYYVYCDDCGAHGPGGLTEEYAIQLWDDAAPKNMEAVATSRNKPMPKLPTLEECHAKVQSHIWGGDRIVGTSSNITEVVYKFICRQLSA